MSDYTYCVITKVPDPNKGDSGNLASVFELYKPTGKKKDYSDVVKRVDPMIAMDYLQPVFTPGEIVILDEPYGREIGGIQRAPRKWFIEYEEFDNIEEAVKCAKKVLNNNREDK